MEGAGDEPVASTGSPDGRHDDDGGDGDGEPDRTKADSGSDAGGGGGRTVAASLVRAWRRAPRLVVLAVGITALAMLMGGMAMAGRVDGDTASPATTPPHPRAERSSTRIDTAATTTSTVPTTTVPTTTTTEPPTTTTTPSSTSTQASDGTSGPQAATSVASRPTCGPIPWPTSGRTLPTVQVAPGQAAAYGPPTTACSDVAQGCSVSFTLKWSDGYTETRSQVLTGPGTYTLSGDRGTTWNFAVSSDLYCSSSGGNYSNVWPGDA